ncbi:MAG: hypothetical protein U0835_12380 [Isosphaeraceae bacterium]
MNRQAASHGLLRVPSPSATPRSPAYFAWANWPFQTSFEYST